MKLGLRRLTLAAALAASASAAIADVTAVPANTLVARGDEVPALTVSANGVQIYECKAAADGKLVWTFKEPRADLTAGGVVVGKHYAGPHWELLDGSTIKGALAERSDAPSPADIPWLRLNVAESNGNGQLTGVTAILRLNTKGGTLSGACASAGALQEQPYLADYVFFNKK